MAMTLRGGRAIVCRGLVLALAGILSAGCGLVHRHDSAPTYSTSNLSEPYPAIAQPTVAGLNDTLGPLADAAKPRIRPIHILAIGAAGVDCPFNAGVLVGWTRAGTRPRFDVVTGSSSGALVGAFAFLGPKYDGKLESLFTDLATSDLFQFRPVRALICDGAIGSAKPMERFLEREINETYLADLRQAHAEGRRFFVGTTNLETKRQVVWDMGAIASSGRTDAGMLVRKILQATTTWPGLLPPVEFQVETEGRICREHHIDGGATAQSFVRLGPTAGWPKPGEVAPGWMAGSNLYVLAGGRLYDAPAPVSKRFFSRILAGTSSMINAMARSDMNRLHTLCLSSGMRYHLIALPADYQGAHQSILNLDRAEMCRLFDTGYRLTMAGPRWRHTPPGAEPGEEEIPRGALPNLICR